VGFAVLIVLLPTLDVSFLIYLGVERLLRAPRIRGVGRTDRAWRHAGQ
jgi:hypothetical protein